MTIIRVTGTLLLLLFFHIPFSHKGVTVLGSDDQMKRLLWVDSTLQSMTLDEKIGQLFMIRAHTDKGQEHLDFVEHQVKNLKVGGICLFQGTKDAHTQLVHTLQKRAKIPLFVAIDAEWGINMRLQSETAFPKAMSLGAVTDHALVSKVGAAIGKECLSIGVNMNFAPVLDVNCNPENPVINYRSFGENAKRVARLGTAFSLGMLQAGVIPCGKHFPGHGDTSKDSHYDLPVIQKSIKDLQKQELLPFKNAIQRGIPAIMTAHLQIPSLDSTQHLPSSLSSKIVTELLQDSLAFNGLIITDALEMQGVRKHYTDEEIALMAFHAGNDILLLPNNIQIAIASIKEAVVKGSIAKDELDKRVKKILRFKYNLDQESDQNTTASQEKEALIQEVARSSMVLLSNEDNVIPLSPDLDTIDLFVYGATPKDNPFYREISKRLDLQHTLALMDTDLSKIPSTESGLSIVSLHFDKQKPSNNYGISTALINRLKLLNKKGKMLIVYFGNPYGLKQLESFGNIVLAHENRPTFQWAAAKAISGYSGFSGVLPVSVNERWKVGKGFFLDAQKIFEYASPKDLGLNLKHLDSIELICKRGIRKGAFPSAVVLAAKGGKIFYHKAFGYQSYSQVRPVDKHTVYDLASITKVAATTLALMKLVDQGKLDIDKKLSDYLPVTKGTNKENLVISDILEHRAGLKPWIPFYENTLKRTRRGSVRLSSEYYKNQQDESFSIPVDGVHYLRNDYTDSILFMVLNSDLLEKTDYRYSDLGFYLMHQMIEEITGKTLEGYLREEFYKPLSLHSIGFNPYAYMNAELIPPTEYDQYFRNREIRGYVHDMGAAMLGGVSGHAGLFGNAEELAVIFQMLLNGGSLMDKELISKPTIQLFTRRHQGTRRALGFDMKELNNKEKKSTHPLASDQTFGHFGFTGTAVWADPEQDLIYVFLSNRTYPSMNNYKINKMDIRRKVQGLLYRSLQSKSDHTTTIEH